MVIFREMKMKGVEKKVKINPSNIISFGAKLIREILTSKLQH